MKEKMKGNNNNNNINEETLNDVNENIEDLSSNNLKTMFNDFYKKVDDRVKNVSNELKTNFIPKTEKKLKDNIFTTVLISLAIGFILGTIVMLFGFLNGKRR